MLLPTIFDDSFKVNFSALFAAEFHLLSCEFDNVYAMTLTHFILIIF